MYYTLRNCKTYPTIPDKQRKIYRNKNERTRKRRKIYQITRIKQSVVVKYMHKTGHKVDFQQKLQKIAHQGSHGIKKKSNIINREEGCHLGNMWKSFTIRRNATLSGTNTLLNTRGTHIRRITFQYEGWNVCRSESFGKNPDEVISSSSPAVKIYAVSVYL